ncbi:sporulation protein YtfJ [Terrilactibacillus sp. BCM23-1]|uniref:Sporulation protein YtfJ n=1 Tax=Terrilactibacillus tamarindi TaxID=2599694 RepID=A0A6N8CNU0_9BACI|nr:GerW family sporulation protein [Terrilactibacillus tamarindi]MTT31651.1 sporulation protein YtfJ [Terrilactibacillus tamarindi]
MTEHPIQGLMKTAMENLKDMIDVNTIIGEPIQTPDGSIILTVSKVGFGFAAGGSDFGKESNNSSSSEGEKSSLPFGGGSGGGVSVTPIAFLIVGTQGVKTIHLDNNTHLYEKLLELAPQTVDKIQKILESSKNKGSGSGNQMPQTRPNMKPKKMDPTQNDYYS